MTFANAALLFGRPNVAMATRWRPDETTAISRRDSSEGGSGNPQEPNPTPSQRTKRFFQSPATPWTVPDTTERKVSRLLTDDRPPKEIVRDAAIALSDVRANEIIDDEARKTQRQKVRDTFVLPSNIAGHEIHSVEDVQTAIIAFVRQVTGHVVDKVPSHSEFMKLMANRTEGAAKEEPLTFDEMVRFGRAFQLYSMYYAGISVFVEPMDNILVRPEYNDIDNYGLAALTVQMHEVEHIHRRKGPCLSALRKPEGLFGKGVWYFLKLLNPIPVVTLGVIEHHEEGHAIGAQWELLHRLPDSIRLDAMAIYEERLASVGITAEELDTGEYLKLFNKLKERMPERLERSPYSYSLQMYLWLKLAPLDKAAFLREARKINGYTWLGIFFMKPFIYQRQNMKEAGNGMKDYAKMLAGKYAPMAVKLSIYAYLFS